VSRYFSLPLLLVVVVIQVTVVPKFRIAEGGPDLVLLLVLSWMLLAGMEEGVIWAILGGVLQDLITGIPLGTTALALVVVSSTANLIVGEVGPGNLIYPPIIAAAGTVLYHVLLVVLFSLIGRPVELGHTLLYVTLPTALFNVVLSVPIFRVMGRVFKATRPRHVSL
jgi:rod shape-determining protein MreD